MSWGVIFKLNKQVNGLSISIVLSIEVKMVRVPYLL